MATEGLSHKKRENKQIRIMKIRAFAKSVSCQTSGKQKRKKQFEPTQNEWKQQSQPQNYYGLLKNKDH